MHLLAHFGAHWEVIYVYELYVSVSSSFNPQPFCFNIKFLCLLKWTHHCTETNQMYFAVYTSNIDFDHSYYCTWTCVFPTQMKMIIMSAIMTQYKTISVYKSFLHEGIWSDADTAQKMSNKLRLTNRRKAAKSPWWRMATSRQHCYVIHNCHMLSVHFAIPYTLLKG